MKPDKRKMTVPKKDVDGLLGMISDKRSELPKAPVQTIQPVHEVTYESKNVNTLKQENVKTVEQENTIARKAGGRPSLKKTSIEYIKMSPRIPKPLKKQVDIALIQERFQDAEGNAIKTLDEIVSFALERLLVEK